jgi:hypothetical protein
LTFSFENKRQQQQQQLKSDENRNHLFFRFPNRRDRIGATTCRVVVRWVDEYRAAAAAVEKVEYRFPTFNLFFFCLLSLSVSLSFSRDYEKRRVKNKYLKECS